MEKREGQKVRRLWLITALSFLVGCGGLPLKGGKASFQAPSGPSGYVHQPQNPKGESTQIWERTDGHVTEKITTKIGAAQKDTAREVGAKLASLRPVMYIGILVFLFGAASFVYPPLKLIVGGSVTTSAMIVAAGLAMIILPTVIVGNELLIIFGSLGVAAAWFFAHRHGKLQGLVDANKDGIDDRKQKI